MRFAFLLIFLIAGAFAKAQIDSNVAKPVKTAEAAIIVSHSVNLLVKTHYKYLGIQANLLLQQFISFNSNSSINTNPYIFSYSKNNINTGNGIVFGTGFSVSENSSNDGVSSVNVRNGNLAFRVGYEKKYLQEQKFITFWGIEFGAGLIYTRSESHLNQSFSSNIVVTESTKIFAGPSFRGGVLLACSKHILLGTEFFFNLHVSYTEGVSSTSTFAPFNLGFQAPTALFLVFRY